MLLQFYNRYILKLIYLPKMISADLDQAEKRMLSSVDNNLHYSEANEVLPTVFGDAFFRFPSFFNVSLSSSP